MAAGEQYRLKTKMNKKCLFTLMTMLMMVMVSVGFASCSKDDEGTDKGGGVGSTTSTLVGTWSRDYNTGSGTKSKETYTFGNGGTGTYKNAYQTATFSYVASGGHIAVKIRYSDSSTTIDDVWTYSISGKTLTLNGNKYTKQ
ncbi:MAG: hypothetical protein IJQ44_03890 [Bacteroidaceae bacterium]|nr:hypothetical protein [Bacteroidaceae bacterium]